MQKLVKYFKRSAGYFQEDTIPTWSAALAYYTAFSLAPLLLIVLSIAGLFFGREAVKGELFNQIQGFVGKEGASYIQETLQQSSKTENNIFSTVLGTITLILGAMGVFGQMEQTLNHIFHAPKRKKPGVFSFITNRLLNFSMVLVIGFLLVVSLVSSAAVAAVSTMLNSIIPFSPIIGEILNFLISFALMTFLFALIYKILPDVKLSWKPVFKGAALTSLLFTIGKTVIGLYLGSSGLDSTYGAAASLAVILIWIYYTAMIFFFGAEFIKALQQKNGK